MVNPTPDRTDIVVLGGGPSGATAALVLARAGRSVLLVERARFPRFHIGESLLPKNTELLRHLGLLDCVRELPHTEKFGVEFAFGHDPATRTIEFRQGLVAGETMAFNVDRAPFDAMLLDRAEAAGATVLRGVAARRLEQLADDDCRIRLDDREVRCRYLLDATGQATFVARKLGNRRTIPGHERVAYFSHFEGVERLAGRQAGFPTIVLMRDGWFWSIPLDPVRTSVGVVLDRESTRRLPTTKDDVLRWTIERCPVLHERMRHARRVGPVQAASDFSYRCDPIAGPGYFLLGDAAMFVDPIFSTGVCLGMQSGFEVGQALGRVLDGSLQPERARRNYRRWARGSSKILTKLIDRYYTDSFRDLWFSGSAPLGIAEAVISLLAGEVFPRPRWALRWRYRWLETAAQVQRLLPIASRISAQSLVPPTGSSIRDRA